MSKETVYISGSVTGTYDYILRFAEAEKKLTELGYKVINPTRCTLGLPQLEWREYMRICLTLLSVCDAIYVIDGEYTSRGVRIELDYAANHGIYRLWKLPKRLDKEENV